MKTTIAHDPTKGTSATEDKKMEPEQETLIEEEDVTPVDELGDAEIIDVNSMSNRKTGEGFEKPNLDGKTVIITNVELKRSREVKKAKTSDKHFKSVLCKLTYSYDNGEETTENYGGVMSFHNNGEWGEPTIWVDGQSASAVLFRTWLKHVGKKAEDVSFKEFFSGLVGLKAVIVKDVNKYEGKAYVKNIVKEFVE